MSSKKKDPLESLREDLRKKLLEARRKVEELRKTLDEASKSIEEFRKQLSGGK